MEKNKEIIEKNKKIDELGSYLRIRDEEVKFYYIFGCKKSFINQLFVFNFFLRQLDVF